MERARPFCTACAAQVALAYAEARVREGRSAPTRTWLLDSDPRRSETARTSTSDVLEALEAASASSYASKKDAVGALAALGLDAPTAQWLAMTRVGTGGFNVTSTYEFSDEMCQGKGPLIENSTRDDLSSKNESGN